MPKKRPKTEITEKDVEELEKVTPELKKREIVYPEAGGGEMIIKDVCKVTYPEVGGGEMMIKKESEIDTHRVELKELRPVPKVKITYPADVVKFVGEMEDFDREYFKIIWLDTKSRVIGVENISQGSINQAVIHPREAAKGAILANAAGVLLIHNHPSGVPEPSREDDAVIDKLKKVFDLVGIKVVDALIIAKEGYYSYTAQGRLDKQLIGGIERNMESREDDACTLAVKAAMETMNKYCGDKDLEGKGELKEGIKENSLTNWVGDIVKRIQNKSLINYMNNEIEELKQTDCKSDLDTAWMSFGLIKERLELIDEPTLTEKQKIEVEKIRKEYRENKDRLKKCPGW